jgi:gamma-glutamyl hercynylcysteine S-oxide hydrolase
VCRHLAYVGEPIRLADLLLTPEHSLLRQSWAPCDMRGGGTVNADGYGIGWYAGAVEPVRLRRASPMWTDAALPRLAEEITSGAVLAAVRSATVGMPVVETACAPFTAGPWLFSHNGLVRGWPESVAALAGRLPVTDLLMLDAPTDSALLWALLRRLLSAGRTPPDAVAELVAEVAAAAPTSRLNLLLTDGTQIVGSAWTHSLWVRRDAAAVVVASEPYDKHSGWQEVPDGHLVTATRSTVDITKLESHD